ncbi:HK97 gp10 family phage protein [Streptomyces achromogenes]|uniref:HK97-gp10 family putative phage morphogenesis protein n=1 Tax=Streptomyces achromogenes TaxID=67255 RepID=UPI002784E0AB|nr:HK97-gp10 family putative phage morphogenesis protein [Streptomyces achromogenes]MDQ0829540.1 HK97 gp10 family phage protein [Streptomyces achromogenes]
MARRSRAPVTITGLDRLRKRLQDLPDEIEAGLVKAVQESAEAVRDDVRRTVPVDARGDDGHHLRDSVAIRYREGGLVAEVGWFDPDDSYATYLEYGTRRRPAQPSLVPAFERERRQYEARLTEEVRRVLR